MFEWQTVASGPPAIDLPPDRLEWDVRSRMLVTLYITALILANTQARALETAAAKRGVDHRARLLTDLEESLEDNRIHEILETFD